MKDFFTADETVVPEDTNHVCSFGHPLQR